MAALSFKTLERVPSLFRPSVVTRSYSQKPQGLPSLLSTIKKANPPFTVQSDGRKRHYRLLQALPRFVLIQKRWFTSQFMIPLQLVKQTQSTAERLASASPEEIAKDTDLLNKLAKQYKATRIDPDFVEGTKFCMKMMKARLMHQSNAKDCRGLPKSFKSL